MGRAIRAVRIYGTLMAAAFRGQAQYRGNLLLMVLGGIGYQASGLVLVWVIVDRFGALGGWSLPQVVFLYALRLTAHGFWLVFFNQIVFVDQVVREGEFDRYLVRPADPLAQLLTRRAQVSSLGDLSGGVILLVVASTLVDVDWSPAAVAYLLLAIVGGGLIEASAQLALASLTFRLLSTGGLRFLSDTIFNLFGAYPLRIFGSGVRFTFTFVVPLAFVAYVPAAVLIGRTGELAVPAAVGWGAPLLGGALILAAYALWRTQTRAYASSGH